MLTKPILLTVDDDPEVLRAIDRDLRQKYGGQFRVLRASSGATALETLKQVKLRGEPVALFLVDQRMPQMTGVELLTQAMTLFPDAKRVLLTAYADTDAAIRAIKDVGKGSGLGLDIAYRIVVGRHCGHISVSSKPGDTRFRVRLPVGAKANFSS